MCWEGGIAVGKFLIGTSAVMESVTAGRSYNRNWWGLAHYRNWAILVVGLQFIKRARGNAMVTFE